jgi:hypothetical protein
MRRRRRVFKANEFAQDRSGEYAPNGFDGARYGYADL